MKLCVSQRPGQSDDAVNIHPSWTELSYLSNAASWRVPSRWAGGAVAHDSVKKQQAVAGSGLEAAGGAGGDFLEQFFGYGRPCDHAATSSNTLTGRCPRFSSSTEFLLAVALQRRVPTVQTVQPTVEIFQVPFLELVLTCPLLCMTGAWPYVPVIMQRQVPAGSVGGLFSVHRQSGGIVVDRDRYFGPGVRRVLCHRGLLHNFMHRVC